MKFRVLGFRMEEKPESDSADLYIFDSIGEYEDWWSGELKGYGPKKLQETLDGIKASKLTVHINSNGGDVFEGIAIYNMLKNSGKEIHVRVEGIAASIASMIAMAGETVTMGQTSMLMIHNCYTIAIGNSAELRKIADDMDKIMESVRKAYLGHASITEEKLIELMDAETYLTADECLEYGLCDSIYDKDDETEEEPEEEPDETVEETEENEEEEKSSKAQDRAPMPDVSMEKRTHWFFS